MEYGRKTDAWQPSSHRRRLECYGQEHLLVLNKPPGASTGPGTDPWPCGPFRPAAQASA